MGWEDGFFIKRLRRTESWKKNKKGFRVWDFDGCGVEGN